MDVMLHAFKDCASDGKASETSRRIDADFEFRGTQAS
jgi:hypothetical protein